MILKIVAGLVAAALLVAFLLPYALKMQDIALGGVIVIGLLLMLADLWQSIRSKED